MKRLPGSLEDDELLEIIEDKENTEELVAPPDHTAIQFLADLGIYPGVNKVSATILYKLYMNTFPNNHVPDVQFHMLLKGYLEHFIDKRGIIRYYYLNIESRKITLELGRYLSKKTRGSRSRLPADTKYINKFLMRFKIKPGQGRIPALALYFFFDKWNYDRTGKEKRNIVYKQFVVLMKNQFKTVRTKHHSCVIKLDRQFFKQFTEEEIQASLDWAQKYNEKIYNKKSKPPEGEKQTF